MRVLHRLTSSLEAGRRMCNLSVLWSTGTAGPGVCGEIDLALPGKWVNCRCDRNISSRSGVVRNGNLLLHLHARTQAGASRRQRSPARTPGSAGSSPATRGSFLSVRLAAPALPRSSRRLSKRCASNQKIIRDQVAGKQESQGRRTQMSNSKPPCHPIIFIEVYPGHRHSPPRPCPSHLRPPPASETS